MSEGPHLTHWCTPGCDPGCDKQEKLLDMTNVDEKWRADIKYEFLNGMMVPIGWRWTAYLYVPEDCWDGTKLTDAERKVYLVAETKQGIFDKLREEKRRLLEIKEFRDQEETVYI